MDAHSQLLPVNFAGSTLFIINQNNHPYVPMRAVVDGMGLDWASQFIKLKQRFASAVVEITTPSNGGKQSMVCLPLAKLAGWLYTISPNKVKPELREKVIKYQSECDQVLFDYWMNGEAKNLDSTTSRQFSTKDDRVPLNDAVNLMVAKSKKLSYSDAYKMIHHRFGVDHTDKLTIDQLPQAIEYVHRLIGEWEEKPKSKTEPLPKNQPTPILMIPDTHGGYSAHPLKNEPVVHTNKKNADIYLTMGDPNNVLCISIKSMLVAKPTILLE